MLKEKLKCVSDRKKCEGEEIEDYRAEMTGRNAKEENTKVKVEFKRCSYCKRRM